MLSSLIVLYLFLGGLGAGIVFVEVIWSLAVAHSGLPDDLLVPYARQRSAGLLTGSVILALGCVCLIFDLERPDRLLYVLFRPTLSIISIGSYLLLIAVGCSVLLTWHSFKKGRRFESSRFCLLFAGITLLFCVGVMSYTGVYLASIKAVAIWNSPFLPIVFVLSSLSCGVAAVFLVFLFVEDGWRLRARLHGWHGFHLVILVLEALALIAYVALMAQNVSAAESTRLLMSPEAYGVWFVGGVGLLGLVVPLCEEAFEFFVSDKRAFPVGHILCILGGFLLRFCLVGVGLH